MKIPRFLAALLAMVFAAGHGAAQVEIHITGASGFRDTAYQAIRSLFGENLVSQNPADAPSTPLQLKVNWTGRLTRLFGDQTVTIRASYNNVVPGVQDLLLNRDVPFLASATPGDTNLVGPGFKSDLVFSSLFQMSTPYRSPVLEDVLFGATALVLVKSRSAPAALTNLTTPQLRTLAANGALPAWFFTGDTNDTAMIHFLNRDAGAGQRIALFKEAHFFGTPISYLWNPASDRYEVDPIGRSSAGEIRDTLNHFGPAIGYTTMLDAFSVNGGENVLRYNGVLPFANPVFNNVSNDYTPVFNGQYGLWVYEHLLSRPTASANVKSFREALIAAIQVQLETSAFSMPLQKLRVERTADGAPVAPIE